MFLSLIKRLLFLKKDTEAAIAKIVIGSECNFCQKEIIPGEIVLMKKNGMAGAVDVCPKCVQHAKELCFKEAEGP